MRQQQRRHVKLKADQRELFDIVRKDGMTKIKNEEDWEFLRMQKQDVISFNISGVDLKTAAKKKMQKEAKTGKRVHGESEMSRSWK